MPRRAGGRTVGLLLPWLLIPLVAGAQVAPNRATLYLEPSDVTDARALWVNPAGAGRFEQASLSLDLAVGDPGAAGRLRQWSIGMSSRGLSFGYQRDIFAGGVRGGTYRIGVAGGRQRFAAGLVAALYRGGGSSTGWDAGVLYDWTASLSLGAVAENLGKPAIRGTILPVTYIPSMTLHLVDTRVAISADGRFTPDGTLGYSLAAYASLGDQRRAPVGLLARLDTDRSLHRAGLAFGLSLGGRDVAGLVATMPGDASRVDAVDLYGVSTRRFVAGRRVRD